MTKVVFYSIGISVFLFRTLSEKRTFSLDTNFNKDCQCNLLCFSEKFKIKESSLCFFSFQIFIYFESNLRSSCFFLNFSSFCLTVGFVLGTIDTLMVFAPFMLLKNCQLNVLKFIISPDWQFF